MVYGTIAYGKSAMRVNVLEFVCEREVSNWMTRRVLPG